MFSDPDFYLFSKINAGRPPSAIWKIPSNVFEIELCKLLLNYGHFLKFHRKFVLCAATILPTSLSTSPPFVQGRLHVERLGGIQLSITSTSLLVLNSVVSVHVTSTSFCSGRDLSPTLQLTLIYAACTSSTSASWGTLQHGTTDTCVLFKTRRKIPVQ